MSSEKSNHSIKQPAAPAGEELLSILNGELDGKFQVTTVLESDVDSYTLDATRLSDERVVIVRLLKRSAASEITVVERFQNEANKLQLLVHHNVPRFLELSVTRSGQPYVVQSHVSGKNLRQILEEDTCLRPERAIHVIVQICAALTAAHRIGINEHNLSPRNIYLAKVREDLDTVKMPGIGFIETSPALGDTYLHAPQNLNNNDAIVYKSPESCLGKGFDEPSTVYSVGCLLYELLTGSVPFLGQTALETGNRHLKQKALLLEEIRPDLRFSKSLQEVVSRALEKEPSMRYSTLLQLQHALKDSNPLPSQIVMPRPMAIAAKIPVRRSVNAAITGDFTGWNLIRSVRENEIKNTPTARLETQIIWMCSAGFFVVVALLTTNILWLSPILLAVMVRLMMFARTRAKVAQITEME